jgi:hypothetical protein
MALWHHYISFFHLIVVFHHITVIHYDFIVVAPMEAEIRDFTFGGRLIYLSIWNMVSEVTSRYKHFPHYPLSTVHSTHLLHNGLHQ